MTPIDLEQAVAASTNWAVPAGRGFEERMAAGAWVRLRARRRRRMIGAALASVGAAALAEVIGGNLANSASADETPVKPAPIIQTSVLCSPRNWAKSVTSLTLAA